MLSLYLPTVVEVSVSINPLSSTQTSRREFVSASSATLLALAVSGSPAIRTSKTALHETMIGEGDFQHKADHKFCQLPEKYHWQTTHNVAVDSANNLYVIHEGRKEFKDHPSIFVFDAEGRFIRAFGS